MIYIYIFIGEEEDLQKELDADHHDDIVILAIIR